MRKAFFLLLCLCLSPSLWAAEPIYKWFRSGTSSPLYNSAAEGCASRESETTAAQISEYTSNGLQAYCKLTRKSDGADMGGYWYNRQSSPVCADGSAPDTSKPLANQCPDPTCAGYPSPVAAATNYGWLSAGSISCTMVGGIARCIGTDSATGKQATQEIACSGGAAGASEQGPVPKPVPDPPPEVDVNYPKCPQGSYQYKDETGAAGCTRQVTDQPSAASCTSGNVGVVNSEYVCLPSNPAPAVAKTSADSATAKAEAAKAAPATDAAKAAAKGAASDAQRAKDALDSLPTNSPSRGGTLSDYGRAVDAAKRAAGYAGEGYGGPDGEGSGSGGGGTAINLPTDYNRESTQQDIRDLLNGKGVTMADQEQRVTDATEKGKTDLENMRNEAQNGVQADKDRFFSWVWNPPIGSCSPFTGVVAGYSISWDLCPTIANIRDVLGWLFALFTAMSVYGQLFKRYD